MFYAHFVLAKKGPLARIWLAAHWDKKLTKAHVFETNIEDSVKDILKPKVKMALRTSGHLLLGVVRIYSRKAKYLLTDCNEAFVKIKMAFRPGMVDLPEDNREAAMNAITLPEVFHDFDTAMPDIQEVDIQAQFKMNQTRAEEITMREDYGNMALDAGGMDDGFGEQIGSPEMLREPQEPDFGNDGVSMGTGAHQDTFSRDASTFDQQSLMLGHSQSMIMGDQSVAGSVFGDTSAAPSRAGSVRPLSPAPSTSHSIRGGGHHLNLDAPIQDDGFGGSMASTNQDILAGGLFEDGSLFDDAPASMPPSERQPESEFNDGPGDFGGPGSPGGLSSGGSRGASPAPLESMPGSPTPSHHSLASRASTARSLRSMRSEATARSEVGSVAQEGAQQAAEVETTTLLHNEEESFALAPVEASAMKGPYRTKRKRKLIVDEVKAISGEEMKGQLSDTGDIVTTLDLAPPTKRLMHWKETGGVEKLFALPGRLLQSRYIHDDYSANLIVRASDAESFDMLGDNGVEPDLALEQVPGAKEFQEPLPPVAKETRKGRKRKNVEEEVPVESAYSKRQAELAAAVEEDARLEREKAERLENERNASDLRDRTPEPGTPVQQERTGDDDWLQQQTPSHQGDPAQPFPDQTPGHDSYYGGGATPAYSDYNPGGETPGFGGASQAPLYPPTASPLPQDNIFPSTPVNGLATPHPDQDESDHDQHPGLPQGPQHDFTDQWVSQAATATATGAALPPPRTPAHEPDDWEDNRPPSVNDGRVTPEDEEEYEEEDEEEEGENEYLDEETVEQFEDRVLNKRAAQLHCRLRQRMVETPVLAFTSITKRKDTRKIAAQKFYSLLVLQKFMAVELAQDDVCYGEMQVSRGKQFELDTSKVKAK